MVFEQCISIEKVQVELFGLVLSSFLEYESYFWHLVELPLEIPLEIFLDLRWFGRWLVARWEGELEFGGHGTNGSIDQLRNRPRIFDRPRNSKYFARLKSDSKQFQVDAFSKFQKACRSFWWHDLLMAKLVTQSVTKCWLDRIEVLGGIGLWSESNWFHHRESN